MQWRWVLESTPNPSVLRVHVGHALTDRTIVTSPPAELERPLAGLLELDAVRTLDVHRYRIRLNLRPDADRVETAEHAAAILLAGWGRPRSLEPDAGPRAFQVRHAGARTVAESAEMAVGHPLLEAVFAVDGVSEAIAGDDLVLVRLGRLFAWADAEPQVIRALAVRQR
ncbi:MAG: hypothetical protein ABJB55_07060 [Actinomycetota bacterium]